MSDMDPDARFDRTQAAAQPAEGTGTCSAAHVPHVWCPVCRSTPREYQPPEVTTPAARPTEGTVEVARVDDVLAAVAGVRAVWEARVVEIEAALWRCYELTGADTSDGRWQGWTADVVGEVERLRRESDESDDRVADLEQAARALVAACDKNRARGMRDTDFTSTGEFVDAVESCRRAVLHTEEVPDA